MDAQTPNSDFDVTNQMVLRIAVPMTVSFLTVPVLGLVDIAVVGQFGDAAMIGGLAVGAVVFDIVFSTFSFLRTGTTAFVAQAVGRGDLQEQQAVFWRAVVIAAICGIAMVALSPLLKRGGLWMMNPPNAVFAAAWTYISIRFLAAPFSLFNYAVLGFLLGQGKAVSTLAVQSLINTTNIILSLGLGLYFGFGIAGVAWATVIGEACVAVGSFIWLRSKFVRTETVGWQQILDREKLRQLVKLNFDIMLRAIALIGTFFLFTRFGGQFGEVTLASNAILLNFVLLCSYFLDGLAAASEQLAGRAVGARRSKPFWKTVRTTVTFGYAMSAISVALLLLFGPILIDVMTNATEVRAEAKTNLIFACITALTGVLAYQMDGVFIGAALSRQMRNVMFVAVFAFACVAYALTPIIGNTGLWIALNIWLLVRGLVMIVILPKSANRLFRAGTASL